MVNKWISSIKLKSGKIYTVGIGVHQILKCEGGFVLYMDPPITVDVKDVEYTVYQYEDEPSNLETILEGLKSVELRIEDIVYRLKEEEKK